MGNLEFERNAAFHDQLAGQYDDHLSANPTNRLARRTFAELVRRHVAAGSTLLDFGCGTGLDARQYARDGYRVLAYDNSPGMVAQLRRRCEPEIAAGSVTPFAMSYPAFLEELARWPTLDAVTANFAVLNSIGDLPPLFDGFHERLAPGGCLIASLLNPLHWSKVKTRGWWRDSLRAPRGPRVHVTAPYISYLHFVPATLRAARGFQLVGRANAGAVARYDAVGSRDPVYWRDGAAESSGLWRSPAYRLLGHFVFLVLRRDP